MERNIIQESSGVIINNITPTLSEPSLRELLYTIKQEYTSTGFLNSNPIKKINLGQLKELLSMLKRKSEKQKKSIHEWMSRPELLLDLFEKCRTNKFEFGCASQTRIITNGKERIIYSYRTQDKVIQKLIALILDELYDDTFYRESFGFRPFKSIKYGMELMIANSYKAKYALKLDIHKCFPSINTNKVMLIIERKITNHKFLRLIRKSLNTYCKIEGKKVKLENLIQGAIISPVCSSIFLHQILDTPIREAFPMATLYRYCDDLFILFSEERYVNEITHWVENTLRDHNLTISEKTPNVISELKNGQQFLGYKITREEERLIININQEKIIEKSLEICIRDPKLLPNYLRSQIKSTNISKETQDSWHNLLVSLPHSLRKELNTKVNQFSLENLLTELDLCVTHLLRELAPPTTRTKTPNQCITNLSG
ncbi:reverse transcriptase/maturase family protein [Leptospira levettii]|uniref:reverse transcriptase/maturase family protein n=1 Tax=Leptospira levettii TaxID=2023178 RepID=UPI00143B4DBD|nr:reverse transcriptase/maturase family protein [Leptospira levettii]